MQLCNFGKFRKAMTSKSFGDEDAHGAKVSSGWHRDVQFRNGRIHVRKLCNAKRSELPIDFFGEISKAMH